MRNVVRSTEKYTSPANRINESKAPVSLEADETLIIPAKKRDLTTQSWATAQQIQEMNRQIRISGAFLLLTALWYCSWLVMSVNKQALWLAIPFALANALVVVSILVTFINNWQRSVPHEHLVALGEEPLVAVIVPTAGEPIHMVERTVRSALRQEWPQNCLWVIVSDDAHNPEVEQATTRLQWEFPAATVTYFEPPVRGSAERRGDAKAGNLNAALKLVDTRRPSTAFIETRDADDEVGDSLFLRHCIGQLLVNPQAAYVQTIKEARVSPGDPFGNMEYFFFRGAMLARHASNSVVPCGSGLVWQSRALHDIGGFPAWNLVEDLQSGVEALRRGWQGVYVPIVGAVAQHAPEDIPNVYKQRGTWALDTMRLLIWGNLRGLSFRQRLQFLELGLFYSQSFAAISIMLTLAVSFLFHTYPLTTDYLTYAVHFWPFVAAIEVFLAVLNGKQPYESLLRARQMWVGLAPVYVLATLKAILNGPHRKPVYRVTRKVNRFGWYGRETLPQMGLLVLLLVAMCYGLVSGPLATFDVGSAYWVIFYTVIMGGFVRKSWYRGSNTSRQPTAQ